MLKALQNGTQTDFDGNYNIEATIGEILEFSYIGMQTQSVTVANSNKIDISLKEDANRLEEVVLTGYSKQSTRNITGSVTVVKTEDLEATSQ